MKCYKIQFYGGWLVVEPKRWQTVNTKLKLKD